ncbi:1-acyl-sn-glycerol-3-phosphate acyltransferase [Natronobacillus azotifigens]|uniref:1-acyl-sn-glycerol-3-phosphate acyltransferase n=1 Tax=Natronobacillus azotifigens TaxID=472978 RepID=A0A9J6RBU5_9BACI|nr:lysophospholipid acyltransferase family protein [Natronobacillus azotifigens]MCZ0702822.1 lysophospholipid acyltransferase family protein [Natronobacillus azotifigens]
MKTAMIYLYSAILVIGSVPKLRRAKKIPESVPYMEKANQIFHTPATVSKKVVKKTKTNVTVVGKEKLIKEPVLFVCNHQGIFDILILLGYLDKPIGFIAKKEIKKIPIISKWMEELKCVFIDRSNRRAAIKVIDDGVESLEAGQSMVIFPEGTRSKSSTVNEFKSGSLRLGTRASVPIIPITINGTYRMLEEDKGKVKGANIQLTIGDPIYPDQYKEMKHNHLAKYLQDIIEQTIEQSGE